MTDEKQTPLDLDDVRERLHAIEDQLTTTFVQRNEFVRVILLAVLAEQNYMAIGDPGTAKTSVIDCFTKHIGNAKRFKVLMGKFTQPDDVFGSLDIDAFKKGRREVVTENMLTDCPLPILDETLKASDGCMNSLLGVLGPEREFRGKRTIVICAGGATNWPEVDGLSKHVEALHDRFLMRCVVVPVDRSNKELRRKLYRAAKAVKKYTPTTTVTVDEIRGVASHIDDNIVISDAVIDMLDGLVGRLMAPTSRGRNAAPTDVDVSDRRATQLQRILQVNAWLEGRDEVTIEDFEVLKHGLWSKRKDIEAVKATLDSIDAEAVQEIVKMADTGRAAYRQLQSQGFGVAKVNEVTNQIRKIAVEVQARLAEPVFTKKGRKDIKKAMAALRADFVDLDKAAQKAAGGK